MERIQLTPELRELLVWFCEFSLLVAEVWKAHPTWTQDEIAQEIAQVSGASDDTVHYWVGKVFEGAAQWERLQRKRGCK